MNATLEQTRARERELAQEAAQRGKRPYGHCAITHSQSKTHAANMHAGAEQKESPALSLERPAAASFFYWKREPLLAEALSRPQIMWREILIARDKTASHARCKTERKEMRSVISTGTECLRRARLLFCLRSLGDYIMPRREVDSGRDFIWKRLSV
jgi:hypothetical protein